jgi:hypothetical protein
LLRIEKSLCDGGACAVRGGDFDSWDLEVRGGMFGSARTLMTVEEHGGGKQLARFRVWPKWSLRGLLPVLAFVVLAASAALNGAWIAAACLGAVAAVLVARAYYEGAWTMRTLVRSIEGERGDQVEENTATAPETFDAEPPLVAQKAAAASAGGGGRRIGVGTADAPLFRRHVAPEADSSLGKLRYHEAIEEDKARGR